MNGRAWVKHYESHGIIIEFSTPGHPQGDGLVERQMQRVKSVMMVSWLTKTSWTANLKQQEILVNATPQKSTGVSPIRALMNHKARIGFPVHDDELMKEMDWDKFKAKDTAAKEYMRVYGDKYVRARNSSIAEGDLVFVRSDRKEHKLHPMYLLNADRSPRKFRVVKVEGANLYLKDDDTDKPFKRNVDKVLRCPKSLHEEARDDIIIDMASDIPSRKDLVGIPTELIKTIERNSVEHYDDLKEAVDQVIEKQAEQETSGRVRRSAATKSMENFKALRDNKLI